MSSSTDSGEADLLKADAAASSDVTDSAAGEPQPVKPQIKEKAAKRANASVIGMLIAVGVSLALALSLPLLGAHPDGNAKRPTINAQEVASEAAGVAGFTPLAPPVPEGWSVNYARWNQGNSGDVSSWEVGYTTASTKFVQILQSKNSNSTWLNDIVDRAPETGTRTINGITFVIRDKPGTSTSLVGQIAGTTVIFRAETNSGSNLAEVETLAAAATHTQ